MAWEKIVFFFLVYFFSLSVTTVCLWSFFFGPLFSFSCLTLPHSNVIHSPLKILD